MAGRNSSSNKPCNTTVETLSEVFRCFICMEKLKDAHLCPHCSKLCCYACIRRWLTEQRSQCPHCRATLLQFELVNCRWVEEVTQNLESLRAACTETFSGGTIIDHEHSSERCPDHPDEHLTVFCESCCKCICHRCALWGGATHAGHSFKPIAEVYEEHVQKIKSGISELQQFQMKLASIILKVELTVEAVREARDEKANEAYRAVESMISHLDAQLRSNVLTLTGQKELIRQESKKLETIANCVQQKLSGCSHAELIQQSQEILNSIKAAQRRPLTHFVASPVLGEFESEIVPPYDSGTFVIQNFGQVQAKADALYSPPLHVYGLCWRLKVYPKGNGIVRGLYLSIFLELTAGIPQSSKYEYRIEMIHQATHDPQRSIVREFASHFEVGECWGYNRFFRLDLLSREGYVDNTSDMLELRFHVRAPNYCQESKDQKWYISQLQAQLVQLSAQKINLKESIKDDTLNIDISGTSEGPEDVSGPSSRRLLRFSLHSTPISQTCREAPIRDSTANSDAETGCISFRSNSSSFKSGASRLTELLDSMDQDSDIVSHEPSEDGSSDEVISLPSSPVQIGVLLGCAASPQNINENVGGTKFHKSSSWGCSAVNGSPLQRCTLACNRSRPSHFHSLSSAHVGDSDRPLPMSDCGYSLSVILDSASDVTDEANLPSFQEASDTRATNVDEDEIIRNGKQQLRRKTGEPQSQTAEARGLQFKILKIPEDLRLSLFSPNQEGSSTLNALGSSVDSLEESTPRSPPIPHQPSHELRHLPERRSSQNCASNQLLTLLPSISRAGENVLTETENSESTNAADEECD